MREAEYTQQTNGLRRQVEELSRKLESGGEQRRGEVCEVRLEEVLRGAFPGDTIEAVARGVNGADVRQRVCPPGAKSCGTILYESKHTAVWNRAWPAKLRDDQRAERAEVAVLVTAVLPKDVTHITLIDGVWVTSFACLPGLALLLRMNLLQLASHRQAVIGRGEKVELVYAYLTGDQFKRHVESLVSTYADMGTDLLKEKRALTTTWLPARKATGTGHGLHHGPLRRTANYRRSGCAAGTHTRWNSPECSTRPAAPRPTGGKTTKWCSCSLTAPTYGEPRLRRTRRRGP